jgi:hypothetical protein
MAKTKRCPKCNQRTKGALWGSKLAIATNNEGKVFVHPNGERALGYPRRKCTNCNWIGDFIIMPPKLPATPPTSTTKSSAKPAYFEDDDYDEDYINHFYH